MEGFPKMVRVRSGLELTVRPLEPADQEALLGFFRALPESERLFLKEDVTETEVVARMAAQPGRGRDVQLLALAQGRVVGWAGLHRPSRGWMRHVGEIRAVVAPEHQKTGVGTALVRELVSQAVLQGVEKLVALVAQGRPGAQLMFERLGFEREAVLHGHVRDLQGQPRDLHVLANHTKDLFDRMDLMARADFSGD